MGLIEKLQSSTFLKSLALSTDQSVVPREYRILTDRVAEIELYKLEQRYARRKHRTTFHDVQYVDGEYVYGMGSPVSPVSKHSTGGNWKSSTWSMSNDSRFR